MGEAPEVKISGIRTRDGADGRQVVSDRRLGPLAGATAVLDQALFAGSHFVLNILLARWLLPAEYGAFAAAYSVFLLAGALQHALVVEPMMVFGSSRFSRSFGGYLHRLLIGHGFLLLPFGLLAVAIFTWHGVDDSGLAGAALGLSVAAPFLLVLSLLRRALFTVMLPGLSALGGGAYAAVLLGGSLIMAGRGTLSPLSALLCMGMAAGLAASLLVFLIRWRINDDPSVAGPETGQITREHWGYGRWGLAAVLPMWVYGNIYYILLPLWVGLEGTGEFRALINLAMPFLHTLTAVSLILLPEFVRVRHQGGLDALTKQVIRINTGFVLASCVYIIILLSLGDITITFLYNGRYLTYDWHVFLILGLVALAWVPLSLFAGALRALERPDLVLVAQGAAAATAVAAGAILIPAAGMAGGLVAMALAAMSGSVVMVSNYSWISNSDPSKRPAS